MRPAPNVRLVYLDLNHWIDLAKAATGHRDGERHRQVLTFLRQARASGRFVFPLSATHYMEMAGIANPRQRADVAAVMEDLSGFHTLVARDVVMRIELEAALDSVAKPRPQPHFPVLLLGRGWAPAFGMRGGLRIRSLESDVTEEVRQRWQGGPERFDGWKADAELQLERAMLGGPTDAQVPTLKQHGWDPSVTRTIAEQRATQEREQAARLDDQQRWRRGKLRDVVSVRFVNIEMNAMLTEALAAPGVGS